MRNAERTKMKIAMMNEINVNKSKIIAKVAVLSAAVYALMTSAAIVVLSVYGKLLNITEPHLVSKSLKIALIAMVAFLINRLIAEKVKSAKHGF